MARPRKRPRDRRPPTPGDASALATALNADGAPAPLTHATPDAELAEAQLALGRPELTGSQGDADEQFEFDEAGGQLDSSESGSGGGGGRRGSGGGRGRGGSGAGFSGGGDAAGAGLVAPAPREPAVRENLGLRLVNFLRGSWRELQRVQWPDRRQVFQATGVVIGFVIVAGMFLGLASLGASRFVNLLLK